jgi:dynein heavy chain, axonemal
MQFATVPAQILEMVRPEAAKRGLDTPAQLWAFFVARCRTRLHVALCMSPVGGAFRERVRANPALVNCCTIDWFHAWPADALEAVAGKTLRATDLAVRRMHGLWFVLRNTMHSAKGRCCGLLTRALRAC